MTVSEKETPVTDDPHRSPTTTARAEWMTGGQRTVADLQLADEEIARRDTTPDSRGLEHLDTLRFLLTLPVNETLPTRPFSGYELRLAHRADAARFGLLDKPRGQDPSFTRVARPPLQVTLVTVHGPATRRTLGLATSYAPYAARRIITSQEVPAAFAVEAQYYGVGITTVRDGIEDEVVAPAPFRPTRFTGGSWVFAERVLAHLREDPLRSVSAERATARG